MSALNHTCWESAPSSNPANSRSQLFEPKKAGGGLLLPLVVIAVLAAVMALTPPKAQIAAAKDASSKTHPELSK